MSTSIYMDHAAATSLDQQVLEAMLPYLTTEFYNPSATYLAAKSVRHAIDDARARTAKVLGIRPREVIFTAGATEANNLAIHGVMNTFPQAKMLVSAIEHDSVLEPARRYKNGILPVDSGGLVDITQLKKQIDDDVVLVSIMYANNEIGTVQNLAKISKVLTGIRAQRLTTDNVLPLYFHTDAAQAPNLLTVFAKKLGVDMMSLNGGKIYGPKQSGMLYVATGVKLKPYIQGGGQEFGLRSGTENVAAIVGFSHALEKAVELRHEEEKRLQELRDYFVDKLTKQVPSAEITQVVAGLYNTLHFVMPGIDNERLMMELDEHGIQCAVGSACSASSDEPSHVLKAIGMTDEQAQSSLRFTMGRSTTKERIEYVVKTLANILKK